MTKYQGNIFYLRSAVSDTSNTCNLAVPNRPKHCAYYRLYYWKSHTIINLDDSYIPHTGCDSAILHTSSEPMIIDPHLDVLNLMKPIIKSTRMSCEEVKMHAAAS